MRNKSWPFKNLDIGQSCTIPANLAHKARAYVHVYGGQTRKRFSCKTQPDGSVVVTRVYAHETELLLTLEEFELLAKNFTKARLREIAQFMAGPFKAERRDEHMALIRREQGPRDA